MPNTTPLPERCVMPRNCPVTGMPTYTLTLTPTSTTDVVGVIVKPLHVLPIVFVPGIMGSNLRSSINKKKVWRLDGLVGLLTENGGKDAATRQKLLHPARTEVDPDGELPDVQVGVLKIKDDYQARGWGEVGKTSYQAFLIWLESNLNDSKYQHSNHDALNKTLQTITDSVAWDAQKPFSRLTEEECKKATGWYYPVYAFGYNWLDDNSIAAEKLQQRIDEIIKKNNRNMSKCEQVILVTHSMGGLVARACSKLPGMEDKIAGVAHGVMPATGAAVAYRRCKVGMGDEGASGMGLAPIAAAGAARVIGKSGQEVTAVFAQAPGALQLLPTAQYPADWLEVRDSQGNLLPTQPSTFDPYESIYKERDKWWGLVKEEWLKPLSKEQGGMPITWEDYLKKGLNPAQTFHATIKDYYHPNTYGFYGRGVASFERATWRMEQGNAKAQGVTEPAPTPAQVMGMHRNKLRVDGTNPESVPGPDVDVSNYDTSQDVSGSISIQTDHFILRLDPAKGTGDGTVPTASGRAPFGKVNQMFALKDVEHEPAYKNSQAQQATVYAINKIAQNAKAVAT